MRHFFTTILPGIVIGLALALPVTTLPGCASGTNSLGSVLLPQTFNERIAASYALVTTLRETATTLLNAGKISGTDGANVLQVTDVARAGIDVARTLSATDLTSADAKLTATNTALVALQQYLAQRGAQ